MSGCANTNQYPGRKVIFRFALQCPEVDPADADWKLFGGITNKTRNTTVTTSDTTSDTSGPYDTAIATSATLEQSFDFIHYRNDNDIDRNQQLLLDWFEDAVLQQNQPVILAQLIGPENTRTGYMMISSLSENYPDKEASNGSISMVPFESEFLPTRVPTV